MYHIVYKTINKKDGKIYVGKHSTNNLNDGYLGSGKLILRAINKYGEHNFDRIIIHYCNTCDESLRMENMIVTEKFVARSDTYNLKIGGDGGWEYINDNGLNRLRKGMVTVKDKEGKTYSVNINDKRYLSGDLVGVNKGLITVKDTEGNTMSVSLDDERYLCGELTPHTLGMISVKNMCDETFSVKSNDERYLGGELVGVTKGLTMYKDKNGNKFQTSKDDSRVISGELVGINKGMKIKKSITTCPHCGKTGNVGAMKRWHFDNCKFKTDD